VRFECGDVDGICFCFNRLFLLRKSHCRGPSRRSMVTSSLTKPHQGPTLDCVGTRQRGPGGNELRKGSAAEERFATSVAKRILAVRWKWTACLGGSLTDEPSLNPSMRTWSSPPKMDLLSLPLRGGVARNWAGQYLSRHLGRCQPGASR